MIAYLPKATVQSAKASIPLEMGVVGGDIMQAIAILSVLITAPIGAIGINMTCDKILHKGDSKDFKGHKYKRKKYTNYIISLYRKEILYGN